MISSPMSPPSVIESPEADPLTNTISFFNTLLNTSKKQNDTFRKSIHEFIEYAEKCPSKTHTISTISEKYQIQRRRLYDFVNVLEAAGACTKTSVDTIYWDGLYNVSIKLSNLYLLSQSLRAQLNFNMIFRDKNSISISHLTENFLLCFFLSKTNTIYIKRICAFLSRENGRYKTTLCKLYQISHILEAAGIISKSSLPGEMFITPSFLMPHPVMPKRVPFTTPIISYSPPPEPEVVVPSIESLLNKHEQTEPRRRKVFPSLIL